jgi:hypothetical protein
MTTTELEYAERRMQQKWYDLVMAEQQGVPPHVLERMYNAYMLAVEDYNRCSATQQDRSVRNGSMCWRGEIAPVPATASDLTSSALNLPAVERRRRAS